MRQGSSVNGCSQHGDRVGERVSIYVSAHEEAGLQPTAHMYMEVCVFMRLQTKAHQEGRVAVLGRKLRRHDAKPLQR
jgi:hypothetical protein